MSTLSKRFHAWSLARVNTRFELLLAPYKRRLLGSLGGEILEIGPGTGVNIKYYPRGVRLLAAEPNHFMHPYLLRRARMLDTGIEIHRWRSERLELPDESVDAVVGTFVLCSVISVRATLGEILRVLRPGGRFCFLEHVAAPQDRLLHDLQRVLRPAWSLLADGCDPARNTECALRKAGFARVEAERFSVSVPIVSPHICGWALKTSR